MPDGALRALANPHACNEDLLRVISDVDSEDRVASTHNTIPARHRDTVEIVRLDWLENEAHTGVEHIGDGTAAGPRIRDVWAGLSRAFSSAKGVRVRSFVGLIG